MSKIIKPPPEELPKLRNQSDILWGYWYDNTNKFDRRNIRLFLAIDVRNKETEKVVEYCLRKEGKQLEECPWPGGTFSTDTVEGKALLGNQQFRPNVG